MVCLFLLQNFVIVSASLVSRVLVLRGGTKGSPLRCEADSLLSVISASRYPVLGEGRLQVAPLCDGIQSDVGLQAEVTHEPMPLSAASSIHFFDR